MTPAEAHFFGLVALGMYSIDNEGRIWRHMHGTRLHALKPNTPRRAEYLTKRGYLKLHIRFSGRDDGLFAHRLVWLNLFGPIPSHLEVNHIDHQRTNNHPTNLELLTHADNLRHRLPYKLKPGRKRRPA